MRCDNDKSFGRKRPRPGAGARSRALRRAIFARARLALKKRPAARKTAAPPPLPRAGYDPELLYVECGRCGAPVIWEEGRATNLLKQAGVDPLELDSSCMLMTDACPACGVKEEYSVRIFRVTPKSAIGLPPNLGHA